MTVNAEIMYGRQALNFGEPWIVPEALDLIKEKIKSYWQVFEWGSGGSTVFWSKQCKRLYSVEHNPTWIARTSQMMTDHQCPDNWTLKYIIRTEDADLAPDEKPFDKYADAILTHPDESFHLIYVDGEASCRERCIANSVSKLKPKGILLLDNSNWYKDKTGWTKWDFVAKDLKWVGQEKTFDWWTTILQKD